MFGKKHVPFFVSQGVYSFLALLILLIIWLDTKHTNKIIKRPTYTKFLLDQNHLEETNTTRFTHTLHFTRTIEYDYSTLGVNIFILTFIVHIFRMPMIVFARGDIEKIKQTDVQRVHSFFKKKYIRFGRKSVSLRIFFFNFF